jgi:hypothetical protein
VPELRAAVASAAGGDTVWVAPGEYGPFDSAPLRVPGGVRLVAEVGPSSTVFFGAGGAVLAAGASDSAAVLEGLTVDGRDAAEGGVVAEGARVVVRDCVIRGCWSGIRVIRGEATVAGTAVRECANGVYLFESGGLVSDCEIVECTQGITLVSAGPRIRRTTLRDNVTGVVVSEFSTPVLGGSPERANRVVGSRGAAVRNAARARQTGLRGAQATALDLSYNFWGTDCPDSLLFLGPVTFAPWMDSAGRARSSCDGAGR